MELRSSDLRTFWCFLITNFSTLNIFLFDGSQLRTWILISASKIILYAKYFFFFYRIIKIYTNLQESKIETFSIEQCIVDVNIAKSIAWNTSRERG